MTLRTLRIEHGIVVVEPGTGGITLPADLPGDLVTEMLAVPEDDAAFLPGVLSRVSWAGRLRFKEACARHGKTVGWSQFAMDWAVVNNESSKWDIAEFTQVFTHVVDSWWLDSVSVTSTDHRFAICNGLVLSFKEFHHRYGISVQDHLCEFADSHANGLKELASRLYGQLVRRNVSFASADGNIGTCELTGLGTVPVSDWIIPAGVVILDSGEVIHTVPLLKGTP